MPLSILLHTAHTTWGAGRVRWELRAGHLPLSFTTKPKNRPFLFLPFPYFMKNLFSAALLTAGVMAAAQAQAQITFGPRLGVNNCSIAYSGEKNGFDDPKGVFGVQVGGTANISFGHLAFQPSILFTQKGAKLSGSGRIPDSGFVSNYAVSATLKPSYIELPLNFVYTSDEDHGFQVFAGPYVAFGIGGNGDYKVTVSSNNPNAAPYVGDYPGSLTIEYGEQQNDNQSANNTNTLSAPPLTATFRRFDAGFNAGIGYRTGPIQAQLGYGVGLTNVVPNGPDGKDTGSTGHYRSFQFSANYFFLNK
jgi:hypothetical protein